MKPIALIQTKRKITGICAILVPFHDDGKIDWRGFESHVGRVYDAGLVPAVNMDTGYVNLLTSAQRRAVLEKSRAVSGTGDLVAGAFVADDRGDNFNPDSYEREIDQILNYGATPIIFQSFGLTAGHDEEIHRRYERLADCCSQFIAFELGQMFAPFGTIYSTELFQRLLQIPQCVGLKHSSLNRELEWDRLEIRNRQRPDFRIYTGNDLAIDMVMYGSDYLLGLSTMDPNAFARRDELWLSGDAMFYQLNDALQNLGCFAFRNPVPAYKHTAAMVLKLRGWIECDAVHPLSPSRPASDREILRGILEMIDSTMAMS